MTRDADIINACEGKLPQIMLHFLSRNIVKGNWKATDEEKLIELVVELKDQLVIDLQTPPSDLDEDDPRVLYPKFSSALAVKAQRFVGEGGYRRLCCVSSFFLGLVMLSRVRRHYIHAPWFRVMMLNEMLKHHGGVSECIVYENMC